MFGTVSALTTVTTAALCFVTQRKKFFGDIDPHGTKEVSSKQPNNYTSYRKNFACEPELNSPGITSYSEVVCHCTNQKNQLWFSPVAFPCCRRYDVPRQSSAACNALKCSKPRF